MPSILKGGIMKSLGVIVLNLIITGLPSIQLHLLLSINERCVLKLVISGLPSILQHSTSYKEMPSGVLNLVIIGLFNIVIGRRNKSTKLLIYKFC